MVSHKRPLFSWKATFLVCAFVLGNYLLEFTSYGHWLELTSYELLSPRLPSTAIDLPIVRVDISRIPADPDHPTSREMLESVIRQIAADHPAVIGVDIDFSPLEGRPPSQKEGDFFAFCQELSTGTNNAVPVYLGVSRTVYEEPGAWLGYPETYYAGLAAAVSVDPNDTRRMVRWIVDTKGGAYGTRRVLPSLSQAVAAAYLERNQRSAPAPGFLAPLLSTMPDPYNASGPAVGGEVERIEVREGLEERISFVNYSKLEQLIDQPVKVRIENGKAVVSGNFERKAVLLGDAEITDVFTIPGSHRPIRGLFLNACAAYTFIEEPLFTFRTIPRLVLDVLLGVVLVAVLVFLENRGMEWSPWMRLSVEGASIIVVALLAFSAIFWMHILWTSCVAVAVALCAHIVYHEIKSAREKLKAGR